MISGSWVANILLSTSNLLRSTLESGLRSLVFVNVDPTVSVPRGHLRNTYTAKKSP